MDIAWGAVMVALGLLAWVGQTVSWLAPATAVRLSLTEAEDSVDAVYWGDIRGEAVWDAFTLWVLPLAGALLIAGQEAWAGLAILGGGIYLYFGGRGLFTRLAIRERGHRIGEPSNVRLALALCAVWAAVGLVTALAALATLV
jgi:hypothetical protein